MKYFIGAYEHLRHSGFIELPHRTTLNQYTGFTSSGTGFQPEIIERLCEDLNIKELHQQEKQSILMFDEMKIKSGLVYSKSSGGIIGFTELGKYKSLTVLILTFYFNPLKIIKF